MKKYSVIIAYFSLLILTTSLAFIPIDRFEITDAFSLTFKSADPSGSFKKMEGTIGSDLMVCVCVCLCVFVCLGECCSVLIVGFQTVGLIVSLVLSCMF